jgi:hypothetical protein
MHTLFKLTGAALLAASASLASAQNTPPPGTTAPTEPQGVKEAPLPSKQPPAPGDNEGVGSRAMGGPSQDFSTSNKEAERKGTTPKKLEEQGKSGNN